MMSINRVKILREINHETGRREINQIVSLLQRWLNKNPKRAFMLRMYQEGESGIFIEDDNGGEDALLHDLVESVLFDETDHLHEIVREEMQSGLQIPCIEKEVKC